MGYTVALKSWVEDLFASLGNSSGRNVGTAAGTVAAGDDPRITSLSSTYAARTSASVELYGALGDGTTDDAAAITAATVANVDITFPAGIYRVASNVVIGSAARFARGATIKPDSNITVTLTGGTVEAGWHQIFDTTGGGNISFGNTPIGEVRAVWFGAKANGSTDDTAAIKAACDSMPQRGTLLLSKGTHLVTGQIITRTFGQSILLRGHGREATVLRIAGNLAAPLISIMGTSDTMHANWSKFLDFTVSTASRNYTGDVFYFEKADRMLIQDVALVGIVGHAIHGSQLWDSVFSSVNIQSCGDPVTLKEAVRIGPSDTVIVNSSNHLHFNSVQIEGSHYTPLYLGPNTAKCRFTSSKFHGIVPVPAPYPSVIIDGGLGNTFQGCTWTAGGTDHVQLVATGGITPAGNRFVGSDMCSAGAATGQPGYGIRQDAGDHNVVEACAFGVNGTNDSGSIYVGGGSLVLGDAIASWDTTFITATTAGRIVTAAQRGHSAPMVTGQYYAPEGSTVATAATGDGSMRGGLLVVGQDTTLTEIGVEVTTAGAGSAYRLGIYRINEAAPGIADRLLDAGTVDSTSTGYKSITISLPVARGDRLLLMGTPQGGTPPTVRTNAGMVPAFGSATATSVTANPIVGTVQNSVTGALPATHTLGFATSVPRIVVKG